MGAVRYRNDFYSIEGTAWRIDIFDTESSVGSPAEFNTYGGGFELSYKGTDAETYSPIIASDVNIFFAVEEAADQTLMSDILTSPERRFWVFIYKGDSQDFYWGGLILQDLGTQIDEALPSQITLSAIDGIGLLKNFIYGGAELNPLDEFPYWTTYGPNSENTLLQIINDIFNNVFLLIPEFPRTAIFSSSVTFYEDNMYSGSPATSLDPLNVTKCKNGAFVEFKSKSEDYNKGLTYYKVLEQICLIFNARFCLSDGKYRLYNINQYENSNITTRDYDVSTTYPYAFENKSTASLSIIKTIDQSAIATLSNPNRTYYPNIIFSKRIFDKDNFGNIIPFQDNYESTENNMVLLTDTDIVLIADQQFLITLTGTLTIVNPGSIIMGPMRYLLKGFFAINTGSTVFFLNNTTTNTSGVTTLISLNTEPQWNQTTTNYENIFFVPIEIEQIVQGTTLIDFSFTIQTPDIPIQVDTLLFYLDHAGFGGDPLGPQASGLTFSYEMFDASITLLQAGEPIAVETDFYAWSDNYSNNSIQLEVEDSLIGDADDYTMGKLWIYNTSGNWVNSESWKINAAGDTDKIINLQLQEITKLRLEPNPKLNTQIKGDFAFHNKLVYDSSDWMILGGSLSANSEIWNLQAFEVAERAGTITYTDKEISPVLVGLIQGNLGKKFPITPHDVWNLKYDAVTSDNTKTEIFINGVANARLNLEINTIANFRAYAIGVLASGSDKGDAIVIEQFGGIKNIDETLALIGTTTSTSKADGGIGGSVGISIEPDNTNKTIKLSVTGDASEDIAWTIGFELNKINYADTLNLIFEDDNNIITEASDNLTTQLNYLPF